MSQAHPSPLHGFDEARDLLLGHESRLLTHSRLAELGFLADTRVATVHVDNLPDIRQVCLTGFDDEGRAVRWDVVPLGPHERVMPTPAVFIWSPSEGIPSRSQLARTIIERAGEIVDMTLLREHDVEADRLTTQQMMLEAHMRDLAKIGHARGLGPDGQTPRAA